MTEKKKNLIILFLSAVVILLAISLISAVYNSDKNNQKTEQSYQERIDLLNSQLQNERNTSDNNKVIIENACTNFLKSYYSVQHSNSPTASADKTKAYCTQELFNKLQPQEPGNEYTDDELDIEYSSEIFIRETYYNSNNPLELIISCRIKKSVNKIQSSNEYYVKLTVKNVNGEWLVDDYHLTAVQGE